MYYRESSKSPRARTKKEEVEEELDETIKALEKQVGNYKNNNSVAHLGVDSTTNLGLSYLT